MGSSLIAQCNSCNYFNDEILVGSGDMGGDLWPGYCQSCKAVVSVDLQEENMFCESCHSIDVSIYYRDPALLHPWQSLDAYPWSYGSLLFLCPSCKSHTLKFKEGDIQWD